MVDFYVVQADNDGDSLWLVNGDNPSDESGDYGNLGLLPDDMVFPGSIAYGEGCVWIACSRRTGTDPVNSKLWKIDPSNPSNTNDGFGDQGDLSTGSFNPGGMVYLDGLLFISTDQNGQRAGSLVVVNPHNPSDRSGYLGTFGNFEDQVRQAQGLTWFDGAFWLVNALGTSFNRLFRINPAFAPSSSGGFGNQGNLPSGIQFPQGVTHDGTDLWVLEDNLTIASLWKINSNSPGSTSGGYGNQGNLPTSLDNPRGIVLAEEPDPTPGHIFYILDNVDAGLYRVPSWDPNTRYAGYGFMGQVLGTDSGTRYSMTYGDGAFWISTNRSDGRRLYKFNSRNIHDDGDEYGNQGTITFIPNSNPTGTAYLNNSIYICTSGGRLYRVNPDDLTQSTGGYGDLGALPSGCENPNGMMAYMGDLWIVSSHNPDEVWRINPDDPDSESGDYGNQGTVFLSTNSQLRTPSGIVQAGGDFWILNLANDNIIRLHPDDLDHSENRDGYGDLGHLGTGVDNVTGIAYIPPQTDPTVTIETTAQEIAAGAELQLAATADDGGDDQVLTILWTAQGGAGNFNDSAIEDPVWTAPSPSSTSTYTLTINVTDEDGNSVSASVDITVTGAVPDYTFGSTLRLDSIDDLEVIFDRANDSSSNQGAWVRDAGGRTPTNQTGPGDNTSGAYVYTEASGTTSTQVLSDNSVIEIRDNIMSDWEDSNRTLNLRASIAGNNSLANSGGLMIEGRISDGDAWQEIELLEGWAYSESYTTGGTLTDNNGDSHLIALNGGWVDFSVIIPDTYNQVRVRMEPGTPAAIRNDIALWHVQLIQGVPDDPATASINTVPQTINNGAQISLSLSASGNTPLNYLWSEENGNGMFSATDVQNPTWTAPTPDAETTYVLNVLVTDADGDTDTDSVQITVRAPGPSYDIDDLLVLDSMEDFALIFDYDDTDDEAGHWTLDTNGRSTASGNTGPGTNNSTDDFVYTETSNASDREEIEENSIATIHPGVMSAWSGSSRVMELRAAIAGRGTFQHSGGLLIEGRESDSDSWSTIELLEGWDYSTGYDAGETLTDNVLDTQTVAETGGWVDFTVMIPNSYTQIRMSIDTHSTGNSYAHDIALRNIRLTTSDVDVVAVATLNTQPQTINAGSNLQLDLDVVGNDPITYLWSEMDGNGNFSNTGIQDPIWTAPSPTSQTVYTLMITITDDDGDTDSETVEITVRAAPTIPTVEITMPPGPVMVNSGEDVVLTATSDHGGDGEAITHTWASSGGVGHFDDNMSRDTTWTAPIISGGSPSESYILTLIVTDSSGNSVTDTVEITVLPLSPTNPTVVIDTPTEAMGSGLQIDLMATTGHGGDQEPITHRWSVEPTGEGIFGNPAMKDTTWTAPSVTEESTYTLTLTVTDASGNESTDSIDIIVVPPPTAEILTVTHGTARPQRATPLLSRTTGRGLTYQWVRDSGPGTTTFSQPNSADTMLTVGGHTGNDPFEVERAEVRLDVTDEFGNTASSGTLLVTALYRSDLTRRQLTYPAPDSDITVDGGDEIRVAAYSNQTAGNPGWRSTDNLGEFRNVDDHLNTTWVAPFVGTDTVIEVGVPNTSGQLLSHVNVLVRGSIEATIETRPRRVTSGELVNLSASAVVDPDVGSDVVTWLWSANGGTFSGEDTATPDWTAPTPSEQTEYTITAMATASNGATSTKTIIITVRAPWVGDPEVTAWIPALSTGIAESTPQRVIAIANGNGLTYSWTVSAGGGTFDNPNQERTLWNTPDVSESTSFDITCTVTDSNGMTASSTISQSVGDYSYNSFSYRIFRAPLYGEDKDPVTGRAWPNTQVELHWWVVGGTMPYRASIGELLSGTEDSAGGTFRDAPAMYNPFGLRGPLDRDYITPFRENPFHVSFRSIAFDADDNNVGLVSTSVPVYGAGPPPSLHIPSGNSTISPGSSVSLSAILGAGEEPITYRWTARRAMSNGAAIDTVDQGTFSSTTGLSTVWTAPTPDDDTIYRVQIEMTDRWGRTEHDFNIVTVAYPTPTVDMITQPQDIFAGSPITLQARVTDGTPPMDYGWSGPPGSVFLLGISGHINGIATRMYRYDGDAPANDTPLTISYTATDARGRSASDSVILTLLSAANTPGISIDTSPITIDAGSDIDLMATATGADNATFQWESSPAAGTFSGGGTNENTTWTAPRPLDQTVYTLTITMTVGGNTFTDEVRITVRAHTGLAADLNARASNLVFGGSRIFLDPTIQNPNGNSLSYQWSATGGAQIQSPSSEETFVALPTPSSSNQNVRISLQITDSVANEDFTAHLDLVVVPVISPTDSIFNVPATGRGVAWLHTGGISRDTAGGASITRSDFPSFRSDLSVDSEYTQTSPAYVTLLHFNHDNAMLLRLDTEPDSSNTGTSLGPQLTTDARRNFGLAILTPDMMSRVWEMEGMFDADNSEPYTFPAGSVDSSGVSNNVTLRNTLRGFWNAKTVIVDTDSVFIDWPNLRSLAAGEVFVTADRAAVTPGETINLETTTFITPISFSWSSSPSGGEFSNPISANTQWTAPENEDEIIYHLVVAVVDDEGETHHGSVAITVSSSLKPGIPSGFALNRVSPTSVRASWLTPAFTGGVDILGYNIRYRVGNYGAWNHEGLVQSPYIISNLLTGLEYQAQVNAENENGPGEWSNIAIISSASSSIPILPAPIRSPSPSHGLGDYTIEADWGRTGLYDHPMSDISNLLLQKTITTKRGRDYNTQTFGKSVAGGMNLDFRNENGEFDRFNSSGPLHDIPIGGTPVRIKMRDVDTPAIQRPLWTGTIDKTDPEFRNSGQDEINLTCSDIIRTLQAQDISAAHRENVAMPDAVRILLDSAKIPGERRGSIEGNFTMARWWAYTSKALRGLRDLEETEGGFLFIDEDNRINFESSTYRYRLASRSSKLTLSDSDFGITRIKPEDPLRDVVNTVRVPVREFSVTEDTELWSLEETFGLEPGAKRIFVAEYPNSDSPRTHLVVDEWIDLEAEEDFLANSLESGEGDDMTSDALIITDDGATTRRIIVENINMTNTIYITKLRTRGKVLREDQKSFVEVIDQDSIDKFDTINYDGESQFIATSDAANEYGTYILSRYSQPQTKYKVKFQINHDLSLAYTLKISDRITLVRRGVTEDYFIEAISHIIEPGLRHDMELTLYPAGNYDQVMILGVGPPLGQAILGR